MTKKKTVQKRLNARIDWELMPIVDRFVSRRFYLSVTSPAWMEGFTAVLLSIGSWSKADGPKEREMERMNDRPGRRRQD